MTHPDDRFIDETRAWVNRAVIGLNLCPFAKAVQTKQQIRYVVSHATTEEDLLTRLCEEMQHLAATDPAVTDTTLLIHPQVLTAFATFNDFLDLADAALEALGLTGQLQIASFHPQYQFAGTRRNDVTNATNRSPHPTLHLLREASVSRAVAAFPQAENIYENNMNTLRTLGADGWAALMADCRATHQPSGPAS